MSATRTITIQEVRRNLPQFFRDLAAGRTYTVISHSKPLVTVSREKTAGQPEGIKTAMEQMLAVAAKSREASARSGHALPADKSYKELYLEDMAEKYDID
jgi:antitoxin (DNA-binding transcriptional repressor) of toxin-antitoxin stability system